MRLLSHQSAVSVDSQLFIILLFMMTMFVMKGKAPTKLGSYLSKLERPGRVILSSTLLILNHTNLTNHNL